MTNKASKPDLSKLRQDIDRIDTQLHDLIMERAALMDAISAAKKASADQAFFLRPGREAHIQRRLWERHKSNFPLVSLLRMWREMINGMTSLQTDLKASFYPGKRADRFTNLVSNQFGSAIPLIDTPSPQEAFSLLETGEVTAAVIPPPTTNDLADWWRGFSEMRRDFSVIMRLPFARAGNIWPQNKNDRLEALVVSRGQPEQSGDDYTIMAAELTDPNWTPSAESPLELLAVKNGFALLSISGFHSEQDIQSVLPNEDKANLTDLQVYGAYASPIELP
jgi:chorismate mutase / prephenate dehydratase